MMLLNYDGNSVHNMNMIIQVTADWVTSLVSSFNTKLAARIISLQLHVARLWFISILNYSYLDNFTSEFLWKLNFLFILFLCSSSVIILLYLRDFFLIFLLRIYNVIKLIFNIYESGTTPNSCGNQYSTVGATPNVSFNKKGQGDFYTLRVESKCGSSFSLCINYSIDNSAFHGAISKI
ncbi:hypothetical protein GUJ93_ZPchr0014g47230 [Zizania palustris]|uniref:Uncharacterized protein n=1 Tax=Zizania palustris TaxID=103762 RepID=A0A8J5VRK8_ZIZPA|nr:hypothetical protein GUJ93_ZPchr0014g47230 [Zizania palustris]